MMFLWPSRAAPLAETKCNHMSPWKTFYIELAIRMFRGKGFEGSRAKPAAFLLWASVSYLQTSEWMQLAGGWAYKTVLHDYSISNVWLKKSIRGLEQVWTREGCKQTKNTLFHHCCLRVRGILTAVKLHSSVVTKPQFPTQRKRDHCHKFLSRVCSTP